MVGSDRGTKAWYGGCKSRRGGREKERKREREKEINER